MITLIERIARALCRLNHGLPDVDRMVGSRSQIAAWKQYIPDAQVSLEAILDHIIDPNFPVPFSKEDILFMVEMIQDAIKAGPKEERTNYDE